MDEDLGRMSREQLLGEVKKLGQGIREHRDSTGQELCWHHPALWGLLPEKTDPMPVVPDWPQFLQGCLRYRQSLDEQGVRQTRLDMNAAEESRRRRDELKSQYGTAYQRMSSILFAEDPIGINVETNTDEYKPEFGTILSRLRGCDSIEDVRGIVHEKFVQWFGSDTAGAPERYQRVAKRVWEEVVPELS